MELLQKFQRDLNRIVDADRNTRKRGLLKLLEDLPWSQHDSAMKDLVLLHLLQPLITTLSDVVEKCREISLKLINKCIDNCALAIPNGIYSNMVTVLCSRINDTPFPEPTEELRLQVIELLHKILLFPAVNTSMEISTIEMILQSLTRALVDPFPAAKRACGELVVLLAEKWPQCICSSFKKLLYSLHGNAQHQHSKTRVITLRAIGNTLACMTQDERSTEFEAAMKEPLLPLFHLLVADNSTGTRKELAYLLGLVLGKRVGRQPSSSSSSLAAVDLELIVLLFLLFGDETEECSLEDRGLQ